MLRSFLHLIKATYWIFFHEFLAAVVKATTYVRNWCVQACVSVMDTPRRCETKLFIIYPSLGILDLDTRLRPCVLTSQRVYMNSFQMHQHSPAYVDFAGFGFYSIIDDTAIATCHLVTKKLFCEAAQWFQAKRWQMHPNSHNITVKWFKCIKMSRSNLTRMIKDGSYTRHKWICYNIQHIIFTYHIDTNIAKHNNIISSIIRYSGSIILDSGLFWIVFAHSVNTMLPGTILMT